MCNNDRTIKVYRLPSMVLTTTLRTATPINYACLSPDMRHLCCVGDDASTVLYEATPLGYQLHAVYEEASDAGMYNFPPAAALRSLSF